jgi:hypothetical protein
MKDMLGIIPVEGAAREFLVSVPTRSIFPDEESLIETLHVARSIHHDIVLTLSLGIPSE